MPDNVDANALLRAINTSYGTERDSASANRKDAALIYWRMCSDPVCPKHISRMSGRNDRLGWLVVGTSEGSDAWEFKHLKHWTPMPEYGWMPYGLEGAAPPERRFLQLIEQGGIKEFPASQLIAYNWDKLPAVQQARPDVANVQRIQCEYGTCYDRQFITEADYRNHVKVWHAKTEGTDAIARAFAKQADAKAGLGLSDEDMVRLGTILGLALQQANQPAPPAPLPVGAKG
jgi:hypothetical protein